MSFHAAFCAINSHTWHASAARQKAESALRSNLKKPRIAFTLEGFISINPFSAGEIKTLHLRPRGCGECGIRTPQDVSQLPQTRTLRTSINHG